MTLASPVVSIAVAAVVLTNETVNFTQIAGMAVVLGALGLLLRQRSQ
jgi:drug/metabolite transporter (DMT)-like permease